MADVNISWDLNEPADGQVEYGLTAAYGSVSPRNATLSTHQSITLTNLTAGTLYHYRVRSADAAGNTSYSTDAQFTTASPSDTTAPTIISAIVDQITTTTARIVVTLGEPATCWVEYGLTSAYGSSLPPENSFNYAQHVQQFVGLTASSTYHYRVKTSDATGNVRYSADLLFTTAAVAGGGGGGGTRPWALPVTTNTVAVPAGSNVQAIVNAAPNGTVFNFAAGAIFTMSAGIALSNRNNLIFNLNGSTIKTTGGGGPGANSAFYINNGTSHITISNGTLTTSNPDTGAAIYHAGQENAMGVICYNGSYIEMDRLRVVNTWGDGCYWSDASQYAWVHDCVFDYIGRMGVAFIQCQHVIIERNTFDHVALIVYDIEPNSPGQVVDDIHVQDNTSGIFSVSAWQTNWFAAAATNAANGTLSNIYFERNVSTSGPLVNAYNAANKGGLCINFSHDRINGLQFKNNSTTVAGVASGGYPSPFYFNHVDRLVCINNTQPMISGVLVTAWDSPGAVTSPNP